MIKNIISLMALMFIFGWLSADLYASLASEFKAYDITLKGESPGFVLASKDTESPLDRVAESDIHVYKDRVIINIQDAQWSTFTDTNSMDPVLDFGANAIQIVPKSEDDIRVGDIVSYKADYADGIIIHRVIEKGVDSEGTYFILKGDNNPRQDPGKVRFSQIKRVVVAIIY